MVYQVTYATDRWERAAGRPGAQQLIVQALDGGRRLIVDLTLGPTGKPQIVSARIEQSYISRREGLKWRTVETLRAATIALTPQS